MGAHEAYTPDEARERSIKAAVVIEAVGHPLALETAIDLTAPGGRTVTVGLPQSGRTNQCVAVGFRRRGPVADRQLPRARPCRHSDIPHFVGLWRAGRLPVE